MCEISGIWQDSPYFGITWVKYHMISTILRSGHIASVVFMFDIRDSMSTTLGEYIKP